MADERGPKIELKTPTFPADNEEGHVIAQSTRKKTPSPRRFSLLRHRSPQPRSPKEPDPHPAGHNIYLGSYAGTTPRESVVRLPRTSPIATPRTSTSHVQLEHLLGAKDADLETYGLEESRDGFFDATFYKPLDRQQSSWNEKAWLTLPESFKKGAHPLSLKGFLPQQLSEVRDFVHQIQTSNDGIRLFKSFLGFFIAYIICLIPASRDWLGRYNYIIVISAILNHPGRAVGAQIDGAFMTILGTVAGLGWGSLALYVSTSTGPARTGYGGVLAAFLVLFTATIGWLRCIFIRLYQAVLCAGIAVCYTCLANTSQTVSWKKTFDYGIPWVLGQAVCLVVSFLVFPDSGTRSLVIALHHSLKTVQDGLSLPRLESEGLKRKLAWQFVEISQAVRDFTIDITVSRFDPGDIRSIRNIMQGVIRSILAISPDTMLFDENVSSDAHTVHSICASLKKPTRDLLDAMVAGVAHVDSTIIKIGGQNDLHSTNSKHQDLSGVLHRLQHAKDAFDSADDLLIADPDLPTIYGESPDVLELFLFVHPVRQTADKVEALVSKVLQMQQASKAWGVRLPSYPINKAVNRTNAQVRHDRGGLTAGFYFRSKKQMDKAMADAQGSAYNPAARHRSIVNHPQNSDNELSAIGKFEREKEAHLEKDSRASRTSRLRYRFWEISHRLQGFESRFAFKVTLATTLLSIPAWLPQSRGWWSDNESWWAVVTVWNMIHPRVGGTFQDLTVRTLYAAIGAIWGGLGYAADNGNPYVMAVFAAIYMVPLLHRYTQSSHPRSGTVGCISFTVVSLSACTEHGQPSIITIAWTRGLAFVLGVIAALVVNWVLWPFIARHELRKSLSAMMLHSAILYRGVIAKYIYFSEGEEPGPEDIAESEMLEGRVREGFVRMRQLLELTRHEMRLRAPFDPLPYSALISACESFFEHLVQVRQSSLYFHPSILAPNQSAIAALTNPRRDAVAVILLDLYVLACALREGKPVPRYLPSAAAARQKLLDRMEELEAEEARKREMEVEFGDGKGKASGNGAGKEVSVEDRRKRRWADVYRYAYSTALTDIVEALQELRAFTKEVCGEVEWESDVLVSS